MCVADVYGAAGMSWKQKKSDGKQEVCFIWSDTQQLLWISCICSIPCPWLWKKLQHACQVMLCSVVWTWIHNWVQHLHNPKIHSNTLNLACPPPVKVKVMSNPGAVTLSVTLCDFDSWQASVWVLYFGLVQTHMNRARLLKSLQKVDQHWL